MVSSAIGDISISGLGIQVTEPTGLSVGDRVQVVLPDVGIARAFVKRAGLRIGVEFDFHSEELRDRLIVSLFTNGMEVNAYRPSAIAVAGALIKRIWSADLSIRQEAPVAVESAQPAQKLDAITRLVPPSNRQDLKTPRPRLAASSQADRPEGDDGLPLIDPLLDDRIAGTG